MDNHPAKPYKAVYGDLLHGFEAIPAQTPAPNPSLAAPARPAPPRAYTRALGAHGAAGNEISSMTNLLIFINILNIYILIGIG